MSKQKALMMAATVVAINSCASAEADNKYAAKAGEYLSQGLLDVNGVPGMAFAVEINGEQQWSFSAGLRDIEARTPVDAETQFRFASVSKTFAATAAAKLFEDGKLDIDAPITNFVSDYPAVGRDITARQLAAHLSGIPHYQAVDAGRGDIHYGSVAESLDVFKNRVLLFSPGTDYHYSSYGYTLLSAVVEGASGMSYLDYVQNELLKPTGLDDIGSEDVTVENAALTKMYEVSGGGVIELPVHDYSYSWGGAGMRGTAGDLAAFGSALLGGNLLSRDTLEFIMTPTRTDTGETVGRYDYHVGFGWRVGEDYAGRRVMHHAGVTPGARSVLLVYPDNHASVAVLSNARWVSQIERTATLFGAMLLSESIPIDRSQCKEGRHDFTGSFDGAATSGSLQLDFANGVCSGILITKGALKEYFLRYQPQEADGYRAVVIETSDAEDVIAVATPIGLADFHWVREDEHQSLTTIFGESHSFNTQMVVSPDNQD